MLWRHRRADFQNVFKECTQVLRCLTKARTRCCIVLPWGNVKIQQCLHFKLENHEESWREKTMTSSSGPGRRWSSCTSNLIWTIYPSDLWNLPAAIKPYEALRGPRLLYGLGAVSAYVPLCESMRSCHSGFVSKRLLPRLEPELLCCSVVTFCEITSTHP